MLVIMALVTTFMTSPLLEWTYPKRLIREDVLEAIGETPIAIEESIPQTPTYRILVPVANPSTQQGLLKLALLIASTKLQPAAVDLLSLVQIEEDYLYSSTPVGAETLIKKRRERLEELIQNIEPPELRQMVHPLVRVSTDIARETVNIAQIDQADLILMGWHRPGFSQNRLGGKVGQILNTAPVDVAVFVDQGHSHLESLLVPYAANIHDDFALEIALRLLLNSENSHLTVLSATSGSQHPTELSYESRNTIEQLPPSVRSRINFSVIQSTDPIQAVIEASANVDLTILGTSRAWGIERQTLGRYTDQLAVQCRSSLLITRRYSRVTSHLASILPDKNNAVSTGKDESGVGV